MADCFTPEDRGRRRVINLPTNKPGKPSIGAGVAVLCIQLSGQRLMTTQIDVLPIRLKPLLNIHHADVSAALFMQMLPEQDE